MDEKVYNLKRRLSYIVSRDSVSENIFQRWKFERWLKKNGGHTVSHKDAECAYREGKIVNLVEYCPEVFDDEYESESHCIIADEVKRRGLNHQLNGILRVKY